jgi:hypothetical protein
MTLFWNMKGDMNTQNMSYRKALTRSADAT